MQKKKYNFQEEEPCSQRATEVTARILINKTSVNYSLRLNPWLVEMGSHCLQQSPDAPVDCQVRVQVPSHGKLLCLSIKQKIIYLNNI